VADPFVSATEFSEFLGQGVPVDPARVQSLLAGASALIRGYTGQTLSTVTGDVIIVQPEFSQTYGRLNPPPRAWGDIIYLPERPVTACTMTVAAVSFTAFSFNADGVVWRTDGLWWDKAATITYDHGYAETSEEMKEIKAVAMECAARAYAPNASGSPELLSQIALESQGYAPSLFLTDNEKDRLPGQVASVG
jgi:hypothetical protein